MLSVQAVGPEFRVNTYTSNPQLDSSLAMDADGDFVVVWNSDLQDGSGFGIFGERFNAVGVAQGAEFRVNTYTASHQIVPSVAMDADGDFVVVWQSYGQDGSDYGVIGRRFNAAGVAQGAEFRVNTYTAINQGAPSVAMDADGDFVVVWESYQDGSARGIYGQRYNAAGAAQGAEFRINTWTTGEQQAPSVAMDANGNFVVVWQSLFQSGNYEEIYAQRYDADGLAQGIEFQVNTYTTHSQTAPSVAMDANGDFVVVWASYYQDGSALGIYGQRYNAAGAAQGAEFRISTWTTDVQKAPSVAMDVDGDFVVTWDSAGQDGSVYGVYAQRFSSLGIIQGPEFRANTYTSLYQVYPSVAMDASGNFVVAWSSSDQDGSSYGIYAQRFGGSTDTAGAIVTQVLAGDRPLNDGDRIPSGVGQLTVAFSENLSTRALLSGVPSVNSVLRGSNWTLTKNGKTIFGALDEIEFNYNPATLRHEATLVLKTPLAPGAYQLTAKASIQDRAGNALDGDANGAPGGDFTFRFRVSDPPALGGEFRANVVTTNDQIAPSVATDAYGNFVVVWQGDDGSGSGIFAQRFDATGVAQGAEFQVNTYTTSEQRAPEVAMDADGDFVVVWESDDGSGFGVYGRRFSAAGLPLGSESLINTHTTNSQLAPEVAMDAGGDFVVVWQSFAQDGDGYGVYGQRFDAAGMARGTEFRVNQFTTSFQGAASVAMDAGGDFAVVWRAALQDGDGTAIYGRRYDADGVAQGNEFQVNSYTTSFQSVPSVAMDAEGDFVVVWQSVNQDGDGYGIYGQRFNAAGVAQGAEFAVNAFTSNNQWNSSVAMDADGDFVVVWSSSGQDGSGYGVYGRRFSATGAALGTEFRANTWITGSQITPVAAMDADGDFIVAWDSVNQDGSGHGVYAQRYGTPPVLSGFGATVAYKENAALPTLLTTGITVTNPNAVEWKDGSVTARVTVNNESGDRLSVVHQGNGANQVGVVDLGGGVKEIRFSNVRIGTATGGDGTNPLVVAFDSFAASTAAVLAVLKRIGYATASDNPSTLPRTVTLSVRDRFNGASNTVAKQVTVTAANDAPTLGGFGTPVNYSRGSAATLIDALATSTITDPDSNDFNTGKLTLQLTNGKTGDLLSIRNEGNGAGQIGVTGTKVFFGGTQIGTFAGGAGSAALVITLNASATKAATLALLQKIQFSSTLAAATGTRSLKATLSDGDGGTSAAVTKTINVT